MKSPSKKTRAAPNPKSKSRGAKTKALGQFKKAALEKEYVAEIFARLARDNPNPRCELYYKTPFQLLVSVVLSAQTTDKMVNRCMQPVYDLGFTPDDAVRLGPDGLLPLIRRVGFAPTKSKNIAKLAELIRDLHGGQVPSSRSALEALPGVGKKTASVILAEIWNHPVMAVDTHVFRVGARLGLHSQKVADKAADQLMEVIEPRFLPKAHHWLILLGRYTCKARTPRCSDCRLMDLCPSSQA